VSVVGSVIGTLNYYAPPLQKSSQFDYNPLEAHLKLEDALARIIVPSFKGTKGDLIELQDLEEHCCRHTEDESRYYAILLRAFAVLKAGPLACASSMEHLTRAEILRELPIPEAAAIRWILGRIRLSAASLELPQEQKIKLTKLALNDFEEIEKVTLRMPVPLPGAGQEMDKGLRFYGSSNNDPSTSEISLPHRYAGSAAISLSELEPPKKKDHFDCALDHAMLAGQTHSDPSGAPRLNIDLLALDIQSMQRHQGERTMGLSRLVSDLESLVSRTTISAKGNQISEAKALEWIANSYACITLVTSSGFQRQQALDQMVLHLKLLVSAKGRVPDFLSIDPIYRRAFDREGKFSELLLELGSDPRLSRD
jgi:hypothetical protein